MFALLPAECARIFLVAQNDFCLFADFLRLFLRQDQHVLKLISNFEKKLFYSLTNKEHKILEKIKNNTLIMSQYKNIINQIS